MRSESLEKVFLLRLGGQERESIAMHTHVRLRERRGRWSMMLWKDARFDA